MKKLLQVLTAVLLLTFVSVSVARAADDDSDSPGQGRNGGFMRELRDELDLSPQQVRQLRPIVREHLQAQKAGRMAFWAQLQKVLTSQQAARLKELRAERRDGDDERPNLKEELDLSPEQIAQIQAYRKAHAAEAKAERLRFKTQVGQVLTPQQIDKFRQMVRERAQDRRKSRPGNGDDDQDS